MEALTGESIREEGSKQQQEQDDCFLSLYFYHLNIKQSVTSTLTIAKVPTRWAGGRLASSVCRFR